MFHTGQTGIGAGTPGGGGIRLKYSNPLFLDDVAADFPDLTIVLAHPSFPWQDEALAVATHKPLVYIDLSGWSPKYFPPQLVQYANTLLQDKVLFGSDYPLLTPDRWLADFDALPIKPEVRPKILKENAARLLGLRYDEETGAARATCSGRRSPDRVAQANLTAFLRLAGRRARPALRRLRRAVALVGRPTWTGSGRRSGTTASIEASAPPDRVLGRRAMPGADWFPGARLNYAQHVLRRERPGEPALLYAERVRAAGRHGLGRAGRLRCGSSAPGCASWASGRVTGSPPTCRTSRRR